MNLDQLVRHSRDAEACYQSTQRRLHLTSAGDFWLGVVVAIIVIPTILSLA